MKQLVKLSLLLLAFLLPASAIAHDFEVDGIYYKINGNEATVTYRGTSYIQYSNEYTGDVIIPASVTYNGTTYSVTAIGGSAFYDCSGLTSVTIPNSVTTIEYEAFAWCSGLTSVTIGKSVISIGYDAFAGCPIERVNISDIAAWCNISFAGPVCYSYDDGYALYQTYHLYLNDCEITDLVIPNSVKSIGNYVFC